MILFHLSNCSISSENETAVDSTINETLINETEYSNNGISVEKTVKDNRNSRLGSPPDSRTKLAKGWVIISYIIPSTLIIINIFYVLRCVYITRKHERLNKQYIQYKLSKKFNVKDEGNEKLNQKDEKMNQKNDDKKDLNETSGIGIERARGKSIINERAK